MRNGFVYTLRPKRRRTGKDILSYHGFGKKGTVVITFIKEISNDAELETFVKYSGFQNVEEWRSKAKDSRFLFRVDLLE